VDYARSGVDLEKLRVIHQVISELVKGDESTVLGVGHYAGVLRYGNLNLAIHTDGVGTKTLLAMRTGRIRNTGVDCVAMNVNDIVSIGARPLALVDYLAMDSPSEEVVRQVIEGILKGADEGLVKLMGGETAVMPDVVNGYDLACTVIGVAEQLKTGGEVKPGDLLIGLSSSGPHSNGFSLIRKLIDQGKLSLKDYEEELLRPTRIYVKAVLQVLKEVKAAAHITGGTFSKLRRVTRYMIDIVMPEPPQVFKAIESAGVPHHEMYRVFNMGVGMILFVSPENKQEVMDTLQKYIEAWEIGVIREGSGIKVTTYKGEKLNFV